MVAILIIIFVGIMDTLIIFSVQVLLIFPININIYRNKFKIRSQKNNK